MPCAIEGFTREALAIRVERRLGSAQVREVLAKPMIERGGPAHPVRRRAGGRRRGGEGMDRRSRRPERMRRARQPLGGRRRGELRRRAAGRSARRRDLPHPACRSSAWPRRTRPTGAGPRSTAHSSPREGAVAPATRIGPSQAPAAASPRPLPISPIDLAARHCNLAAPVASPLEIASSRFPPPPRQHRPATPSACRVRRWSCGASCLARAAPLRGRAMRASLGRCPPRRRGARSPRRGARAGRWRAAWRGGAGGEGQGARGAREAMQAGASASASPTSAAWASGLGAARRRGPPGRPRRGRAGRRRDGSRPRRRWSGRRPRASAPLVRRTRPCGRRGARGRAGDGRPARPSWAPEVASLARPSEPRGAEGLHERAPERLGLRGADGQPDIPRRPPASTAPGTGAATGTARLPGWRGHRDGVSSLRSRQPSRQVVRPPGRSWRPAPTRPSTSAATMICSTASATGRRAVVPALRGLLGQGRCALASGPSLGARVRRQAPPRPTTPVATALDAAGDGECPTPGRGSFRAFGAAGGQRTAGVILAAPAPSRRMAEHLLPLIPARLVVDGVRLDAERVVAARPRPSWALCPSLPPLPSPVAAAAQPRRTDPERPAAPRAARRSSGGASQLWSGRAAGAARRRAARAATSAPRLVGGGAPPRSAHRAHG